MKQGLYSPLRAGEITAMKMAGLLHPPFVSGPRAAASRRLASDTRLLAQSRFLPEDNEKTSRARSKREKEVRSLRGGDEGRGTRKRCFLRIRIPFARGVV